MPVAYPPALPSVLASKRISKQATFSLSQPRRGSPYAEPTGTDTPTFVEVEWLLNQSEAMALRSWVEQDLRGGALEFSMPLRMEEGVFPVTARFSPDGLLDRQREGTLWRYRATIIARNLRGVAEIPEQEVTFGQAYTLNLSDYWPAGGGPFEWQILSGSLPAGITLNTATGVISGTTTSAPLVFSASFRRTEISSGLQVSSGSIVFVVARVVELVAPANCGNTSAVGVTVAGFSAAQRYRMSLLSSPRASWSGWASDASNGGLTWSCLFFVNSTLYIPHAPIANFATSTQAYAASAAYTATVTGSSSYVFWMFDPSPSDNRGGLTIKIRPDT